MILQVEAPLMADRRPREFRFEGLEDRQMLSGSGASVHASAVVKGAVMPYVELTLKGHFVAGAPTTVTFAGKHLATITVTPASVSKGSVVVAVPAFFDPKTGQPVAATAAVSVHQTVGGHVKSVQVIKSLAIARLPQTGLGAGYVLGAVTVAAASVTADAQGRFVQISEDPASSPALRQAAANVVVDLDEIGQLIPLAQRELVGLAFGILTPLPPPDYEVVPLAATAATVGSLPLGTYQGQPATLDVGQLGLLDRIVAGGVDAAIGGTSTGAQLLATLNGLVSGALQDGPAVVIARAKEVVDVLATATGSPVVPPGVVATGLAIGSLSAVVAAAEAEALLIQEAPSPTTHAGPPDLALIDQVLDDPALGQALNAITAGLVPSGTDYTGYSLLQSAQLAEALAARIDPNVPGSAGAQLAD
jgi:hypothetical protein